MIVTKLPGQDFYWTTLSWLLLNYPVRIFTELLRHDCYLTTLSGLLLNYCVMIVTKLPCQDFYWTTVSWLLLNYPVRILLNYCVMIVTKLPRQDFSELLWHDCYLTNVSGLLKNCVRIVTIQLQSLNCYCRKTVSWLLLENYRLIIVTRQLPCHECYYIITVSIVTAQLLSHNCY